MSLKQFIRDAALVSTALNTSYAADRLDEINEKLGDMSFDVSSKLSDANFKLDNLNESIQHFEKQTIAEIGRLKKSVEKGFSDISFELAVQSDIFRSIDRALKDKVAVEAKEYMRFGIKALQNKWYNDAKADFEKSIELNRYDYKVYYLLSKCHEGLGDREKQDEYLEKAFHYAKNDTTFQQYIGLDMAGLLMDDGDLDSAKEVAKSIINMLPEEKRNASPLLLCQLRIDIKANNISDDTLSVISKLIDNHDYRYQIKMINIVIALTEDIEGEYKTKIANLLNLKKAALSKSCAQMLQNSLNNVKNLITNYIRWTLRIFDFKVESKIVTAQKKIMELCMNETYDINISTVENFNKYYYLLCASMNLERNMMNIMRYRMVDLLDIFKEMKRATKVFYDFEIEDDRLLWQVADREDIITLSCYSLIITKNALSDIKKPVTYTYPLDSLDKLEFEKTMEVDAYDDFLRMYKIEEKFEINYYKALFEKHGIDPKKCFYMLKDVNADYDLMMGTLHNFNKNISSDLSDSYYLRNQNLENVFVKEVKTFESVETIMDKAQRLHNAYETMKQTNAIFTSFINIISLVGEGGEVQQTTNDNNDIEFID